MQKDNNFTGSDVRNICREVVHNGFARVIRLAYTYPLFQGGAAAVQDHEVVMRSNAVVVLPYDPIRDTIVMIRQIRSGLVACDAAQPWLLELVAGVCDDEEEPLEAARRELLEETGLQTSALSHLASYWVSPGGSTEKIHAFCACVDSTKILDIAGLEEEGENIKVEVFSRVRAMEMLDRGDVINSASLICLQWLSRNRMALREQFESK